MERFQQQQRLNAQIAQQNAAAAAQGRPNTHQQIINPNTSFERLFQQWQAMGILNSIVNPHRPTGLFPRNK